MFCLDDATINYMHNMYRFATNGIRSRQIQEILNLHMEFGQCGIEQFLGEGFRFGSCRGLPSSFWEFFFHLGQRNHKLSFCSLKLYEGNWFTEESQKFHSSSHGKFMRYRKMFFRSERNFPMKNILLYTIFIWIFPDDADESFRIV